MQGSAEPRTLAVKDYYYPMYPESLRAVAEHYLPWGPFDEIPHKVLDELPQSETAGYEITEHDSTVVMGARAGTQSILVTLASGAMEGVAAAPMSQLAKWSLNKMRNRGRGTASVDRSIDPATG